MLHKSFISFIVIDAKKIEFCSRLNCTDVDIGISVCGLRAEGGGFRLQLFQNECELLKHGCNVDEENGDLIFSYLLDYFLGLAYGLINKEYCERLFATNPVGLTENRVERLKTVLFELNITDQCDVRCNDNDIKETCGIREDGNGYRIRLFQNDCAFTKYNCKSHFEFIKTDLFICKNNHSDNSVEGYSNEGILKYNKNITDGFIDRENETNINDNYEVYKKEKVTNLIVVNSNMFGQHNDINDSIDTFFAASHVFDLPIKEVTLNTRRKWLKSAGPVKVFVPWIVKPKNISNDTHHRPTLSSCYHKCPIKCPDTYAPVCGVPGVVAREPSIMFQNHCFMDVAQCKMYWENKSTTSRSSSYVESSFLFCMGDEMNAVYRFLPAIRTLQHMGRLKKKGKFRAVLKNFRFLSEFRHGRPKFMG